MVRPRVVHVGHLLVVGGDLEEHLSGHWKGQPVCLAPQLGSAHPASLGCGIYRSGHRFRSWRLASERASLSWFRAI